MGDLTLPDDMRREAWVRAVGRTHLYEIIDALAPILLAEGAKQQREIDAGIAERTKFSMGRYVGEFMDGRRVADAIRNQEGQ